MLKCPIMSIADVPIMSIYAHVGSTNVLILGAFVAVSKAVLLHTMVCLCKI